MLQISKKSAICMCTTSQGTALTNDYVEINTVILDGLSQAQKKAAQEYMESITRRFVLNLITAVRMSTVIGKESLDSIEILLKKSEQEVDNNTKSFLAKVKKCKTNTINRGIIQIPHFF